MIYVERITWHPNGEEDKNMRYYIFSLDYYETATKALAGYIRGHWHIGNKRYWQSLSRKSQSHSQVVTVYSQAEER